MKERRVGREVPSFAKPEAGDTKEKRTKMEMPSLSGVPKGGRRSNPVSIAHFYREEKGPARGRGEKAFCNTREFQVGSGQKGSGAEFQKSGGRSKKEGKNSSVVFSLS